MPRKNPIPNRKTWPALADLLEVVEGLHDDAFTNTDTPGQEVDELLVRSFEAFKALGISEDRIRSYMSTPYPLKSGPKPPDGTFDPIAVSAPKLETTPAPAAKACGLGSFLKGN